MGTVEIVTSIVFLMLVAALVRGGAAKLNLPVSVLLFVVGLVLALLLDSYGTASSWVGLSRLVTTSMGRASSYRS